MARFRTRREAAVYLTEEMGLPITRNTLERMAVTGGGPEYQIFGNRAVYSEEALASWIAAKLSAPRKSTSQAGADASAA